PYQERDMIGRLWGNRDNPGGERQEPRLESGTSCEPEVDLGALMQRQRTLERRLALLRHAGRTADRLRGRATEPEIVIADWLEDLALRLQVPWLAVMLWEETEQWSVFQRYPAQEEDAPFDATELAGIARANAIATLQ